MLNRIVLLSDLPQESLLTNGVWVGLRLKGGMGKRGRGDGGKPVDENKISIPTVYVPPTLRGGDIQVVREALAVSETRLFLVVCVFCVLTAPGADGAFVAFANDGQQKVENMQPPQEWCRKSMWSVGWRA